VVLPTRNRAALVRRALAAVLADAPADAEVVVVDDGSTDATPDVLAGAARQDGRVHVLRGEGGTSAAAARNRGIAAASYPLIAFADDDDEWIRGTLVRRVERLAASPSAVLAYAPYLFHASGARARLRGAGSSGDDAWERLLAGNFIATPCVVARRDAIVRVGGFDEGLPQLEDWDLWLRLSRVGTFVYDPEPAVHVHETAGSVSAGSAATAVAFRRMRGKLVEAGFLDRAGAADLGYAFAHEFLQRGERGEGLRLLLASVAARPWPPRRLAIAAAALLGPRAYGLARRGHLAALERAAARPAARERESEARTG
jgi:glycosyltransferase involved in cell wall biosynthesis